MLQDRKIIFDIPSLNNEFIFPAQLYLNDVDNMLIISKEHNKLLGMPICRFSIVHRTIGDISKFRITCLRHTANKETCETTLEPIFRKYCDDNLIDLKFDCINYE